MALRIVLHHGNQSLGIELKDGVYRLGRQAPADVVVADPTVSINHAEIQVRGDEWLVRDLGSTNGTYINDVQIRAATRLRDSDVLRCGSVHIGLERVGIAKVAAIPEGPSAGTVKMQAAREAASKLPWGVRYWIAGAEAVVFLLLLFFFIQFYSSSEMAKERMLNRYRMFGEQYVHLLQEGTKVVPAPVLDESLTDPMIADKSGKLLYPVGEAAVKESPLIDPSTKDVHRSAKGDLFVLPGTAGEIGVPLRSYPVYARGELQGFVLARPGNAESTGLGSTLLLPLLAGVIALIVLFFALRPVNARIVADLESLRTKIAPLANGFVTDLPRSTVFEEANALASEIENTIAMVRASGGSKAAAASKGAGAGDLAPLVAELFGATGTPYCVVDQDFKAILIGPELKRVSELAGVTKGVSIFDAGLTSVQSKQLVQTIGDARRDRIAQGRMQLTRNGSLEAHVVTVQLLEHPKNGAQLFGVAFIQT